MKPMDSTAIKANDAEGAADEVRNSLIDPENCDHEPQTENIWVASNGRVLSACGACGVELFVDLEDVDWNVGETLPEGILNGE